MKKFLLLLALTVFPFSNAYAEEAEHKTNINKEAIYIAPRGIIANQSTTIAGINASANKYYLGSDVSTSGGVFAGGIAAGYDFSIDFSLPMRLEAEIILGSSVEELLYNDTFQGIDFAIYSKYSVSTFFINYYRDFRKNKGNLNPYLSAGIGVAFNTLSTPVTGTENGKTVSVDTLFPKKTNPFLASNLGLGLGYKVKENINIDCGYRLTITNKAKTGIEEGDYIGSIKPTFLNQLVLGVRYSF